MKNIIKISLFVLATAFFGCQESAVDDLAGKYPSPTGCTLTNLFAQNVQKMTGKRIFTFKIATDGVSAAFNESTFSYTYTGTGNYISIDFVGRDYYLAPGAYSIASNETAKVGNYIAGYDTEMFGMQFTNWGTCFFDINGGVETGIKITDGTFIVTKNGDNYTIASKGVLALSNSTFISVNYSGKIVFPEDPPVYTYTNEVSAPYAWTADGTNYTPVVGSQLNKITVLADGVPVAYFELVTAANISSLSGTYAASGEIRDANGAMVQGMYMDLSQYVPGLIIESGSYLLDGAAKQYISSGNLTIVDNDGILTFTSSDFAVAVMGTPIVGTKSINYRDAGTLPPGVYNVVNNTTEQSQEVMLVRQDCRRYATRPAD